MNRFSNSIIETGWLEALSHLEFGTLDFVTPNGEVHIAKGPQPGPHARFAIHDWNVLSRIMARGDIALGEEYIAGAWETDDVEKLVTLFLMNMEALDKYANGNLLTRLALMIQDRFVRRNSLDGAKRNIEAHYDVGNDFYSLWLDKSMTYSSACSEMPPRTWKKPKEQIRTHPGQIRQAVLLRPGDRLRLGRLCRTRGRAMPPPHWPDDLPAAIPLRPRTRERSRRDFARGLPESAAACST